MGPWQHMSCLGISNFLEPPGAKNLVSFYSYYILLHNDSILFFSFSEEGVIFE